ncbi:lytic transglycosylase domain-containing protein [Agromyces mediolanus]|uniref:aggregation-promoting factor C-terminal-like domain-containing protein n=1 Tax=Agromyces mediolanus TaxID=41986 RepID=UPI0020400097|nr:lytic transglycosylase domain-containing protein [Agromyces mediolanus]MCM3658437.1 lytic transglycosylase domain-containing protein [Agromyces mediolanus]
MQNQNRENTPTTTSASLPTRAERRRSRSHRTRYFLAAGAVVALGAMVGTGFAVQSAVAAQNDRVSETSALAEAANLDVEQLGSHAGILSARAVKTAKDTLSVAHATISAADGKVDAAALNAAAASLGQYELLAPERVFELAAETTAVSADVTGKVAEFDRVAAETAAAEAAAKAAAEAAAAEEAASAGSGSGSSESSRPSAPSNPSEAQAIARSIMAAEHGWGDDQFGCLVELWNRESGWRTNAANPSGAYGIPQALPGSKMSAFGADWETNPATQIRWGLSYISGRYGTPCGAWDSFNAQGWY